MHKPFTVFDVIILPINSAFKWRITSCNLNASLTLYSHASFEQGPAATADKASSQQAQCDVGQEGIGDARDPYALLDVVCPTAHHEQSELDRYLSSTSTADDVLAYWHKHGETFPRLAKLAVVCLGVPASSGAVERLFSTAGALQRARRASLAPRTVEQLVLVSEHIRKGSSGKWWSGWGGGGRKRGTFIFSVLHAARDKSNKALIKHGWHFSLWLHSRCRILGTLNTGWHLLWGLISWDMALGLSQIKWLYK